MCRKHDTLQLPVWRCSIDLIVLGVEEGGGVVGEHQLEAADKLGPLASSTQSLGNYIAIFWDNFLILPHISSVHRISL